MNDIPIPITTLRKKIDAVLDDSHELRLIIARIETKAAATQERIYQEMKDISQSIRELIVFQDEIDFIKSALRDEGEKIERARSDAARLIESIDVIARQVIEIEGLKKRILHDKMMVNLNTFFLIIIALGFVLHILLT